jgi:hypothetical protein
MMFYRTNRTCREWFFGPVIFFFVIVVVSVVMSDDDFNSFNTFKLVKGAGVLLMPTSMDSVMKVDKKKSRNNTFYIRDTRTRRVSIGNATNQYFNDFFVIPLTRGTYLFDVGYDNTTGGCNYPSGTSQYWTYYLIYFKGIPKYCRYNISDGILGVTLFP